MNELTTSVAVITARSGIEAQGAGLPAEERKQLREQQALPIAEALHTWRTAHRLKVPDGTGIARALDYSLKRWAALTRYLGDGRLPIDNNWIENQIRPVAPGPQELAARRPPAGG